MDYRPCLLGKGTFGHVYSTKDGKACKKFKSFCEAYYEFLAFNLLSDIPGLIQFERITPDKTIIMPRYDGNLSELIKTEALTNEIRHKIVYQIVKTLAHLHTRGFCHGDLRTTNVLYKIQNNTNSIEIALTDLGNCGKVEFINIGRSTYHRIGNKDYSYSEELFCLLIIIIDLCVDQKIWINYHNLNETILKLYIKDPLLLKVALACLPYRPDYSAVNLLDEIWQEKVEWIRPELPDLLFNPFLCDNERVITNCKFNRMFDATLILFKQYYYDNPYLHNIFDHLWIIQDLVASSNGSYKYGIHKVGYDISKRQIFQIYCNILNNVDLKPYLLSKLTL